MMDERLERLWKQDDADLDKVISSISKAVHAAKKKNSPTVVLNTDDVYELYTMSYKDRGAMKLIHDAAMLIGDRDRDTSNP